MVRHAFIDLGTNSALLLVVEFDPLSSYRVICDEARICRLGEGLHESPYLREAARRRTVEILTEYHVRCEREGVAHVTLVGTEACRRAQNIDVFKQEITAATGWTLNVITPQQEATLSYEAAYCDFKETLSALPLVVDPGGGSTEVMVQTDAGSLQYVSMPIGSVVLTEQFIHHDPPTQDERVALTTHLDDIFHQYLSHFPKHRPLIALAGTATSLAAIDLKLESYDGDRVQGYRLPHERLHHHCDVLWQLPLEKRQSIIGLHPERAPLIPAGALLLARLAHFLNSSECLISDRGVRYGLVYQSMKEIPL